MRDDLERLKHLLLAQERAELQRLDQKLDATLQTLPQQLPDIIKAAQHDARLARALEKPMADGLERVAKLKREVLVSLLFPLIGPIIRRSIAESIAGLLKDLNRALDHSFSPNGLRWRWEALRSGVPFSQVVLKHTLRYRVEHLLLVRNAGGLLLARASNQDAQIADSDAVAAMLSALQDFAHDAINARPDDALARVGFGELTLHILRGPAAQLIVAVRGELSADALESLSQLLEDTHARLVDDAVLDDAQAFPALQKDCEEDLSDWLFKRGQASSSADEQAKDKKPWLAAAIVVSLLLALLAWMGSKAWMQSRAQRLETALNRAPGYFVQVMVRDGRFVISGARDPEAKPLGALATSLGFRDSELQSELQPYLALDPELWVPRLQRMVDLPKSVQVQRDAQGLKLLGSVNLSERRALRAALAGLPYLPVDLSALKVQDSITERELRELQRAAQQLRLRHAQGGLDPSSAVDLERMIELLRGISIRAERQVRITLASEQSSLDGLSAAQDAQAMDAVVKALQAALPELKIVRAAPRLGAQDRPAQIAISEIRITE
jgi:hypothetical protein